MKETKGKTTRYKSKQIKILIATITGIVLLLASYFFIHSHSSDKQLTELAMQLSQGCPVMIDQETRFDSVFAMPDNILEFSYKLVNLEKQTMDTMVLKNGIMPNAIEYVKTSRDMNLLRKNKGTVIYHYVGKNDEYLFEFAITPAEYK